jgi:HEAT repeat protein
VAGLEITFELLGASENETVAQVLRAGLESRDRALAEGTLHAALRCRPPELMLELIHHWQHLSERWRNAIAQKPGVLTHALREAFVSPDTELAQNAAEAATYLCECELVSLFCTSLEDKRHPHRPLAAATILSLAEKLREELQGPRNYETRRDPERMRNYVLSALETAVTRYPLHHSNEVLEAFLLLARADNATLLDLLQTETDPVHTPLCEQLIRSTRPAIATLFFAWLETPAAPAAGLRVMAQRRDVGFFRQLCRRLVDHGHNVPDANLSRIDHFPWIKDNVQYVDSLGASEQIGAVRLVAKSRAPRPQIEKLMLHLLDHGESLARPMALRALVEIKYEHIVSLLETQLLAGEPPTQAEAVKHLRGCEVPNALMKLLQLLQSPHAEVQAAARTSLEEFSFANYLDSFEHLTSELRKASGSLVKRVNPHLVADLLTEMRGNGRARRQRAVEMMVVLEMVPQLEPGLIELAHGEDHALRLEALRLLGTIGSETARLAIMKLTYDADFTVQALAQQLIAEQSPVNPGLKLPLPNIAPSTGAYS